MVPSGHLSLIDEAYVGSICELAGSVWSGDVGAGWPMNWDTLSSCPDCCQDIQGRQTAPKPITMVMPGGQEHR